MFFFSDLEWILVSYKRMFRLNEREILERIYIPVTVESVNFSISSESAPSANFSANSLYITSPLNTAVKARRRFLKFP